MALYLSGMASTSCSTSDSDRNRVGLSGSEGSGTLIAGLIAIRLSSIAASRHLAKREDSFADGGGGEAGVPRRPGAALSHCAVCRRHRGNAPCSGRPISCARTCLAAQAGGVRWTPRSLPTHLVATVGLRLKLFLDCRAAVADVTADPIPDRSFA